MSRLVAISAPCAARAASLYPLTPFTHLVESAEIAGRYPWAASRESRAQSLGELMTQDFEVRPWGTWQVLDSGDGWKVKRIEVRPGHRLSYQTHEFRAEHWVVVSGTATCIIDGQHRRRRPGRVRGRRRSAPPTGSPTPTTRSS